MQAGAMGFALFAVGRFVAGAGSCKIAGNLFGLSIDNDAQM